MSIRGYASPINGERIPFEAINPVRDARAKFGCSPATLIHLIKHDQPRTNRGVVSASQIGKAARQIYLEEVTDIFPKPGDQMAAYIGTQLHSSINLDAENIHTEKRIFSANGRYSAQWDQLVVTLEDVKSARLTAHCDLYDTKAKGWYWAKQTWLKPAESEFAFQLSLTAYLLEEAGPETLLQLIGFNRVVVENLFLESIPRDESYRQEAEARKIGITDHRLNLIPIPRLARADVFARYEAIAAELEAARVSEHAPLCGDVWTQRDGYPLRCGKFCAVREACIDMAEEHGEQHPYVEYLKAKGGIPL